MSRAMSETMKNLKADLRQMERDRDEILSKEIRFRDMYPSYEIAQTIMKTHRYKLEAEITALQARVDRQEREDQETIRQLTWSK